MSDRNSEKGTFIAPFQKFVTDLFSPVTGYMIRFPNSMNRLEKTVKVTPKKRRKMTPKS